MRGGGSLRRFAICPGTLRLRGSGLVGNCWAKAVGVGTPSRRRCGSVLKRAEICRRGSTRVTRSAGRVSPGAGGKGFPSGKH